jgi:hypothetical protein
MTYKLKLVNCSHFTSFKKDGSVQLTSLYTGSCKSVGLLDMDMGLLDFLNSYKIILVSVNDFGNVRNADEITSLSGAE